MKIGIIGLGNVGLAFALLCKEAGLSVLVSDNNEDLVFNLNQNICITKEPEVQKMLFEQEGITIKEPIQVIDESDIIFTFENTEPSLDGNIDTSVVFETANHFFTASQLDIAIYEKKFVICTTTNPGDVEQIQKKLDMFNIQVAYHPNFSENGEIVSNLKNSDFILIGTDHQQISDDIISIYQKIQCRTRDVYVMGIKSAELTKLAVSSFVSLKNTYANMIGDLMTTIGLKKDIDLVLKTVGSDSRIGGKELKYSLGFGGPILPRDNKSLQLIIENSNTVINLPKNVDDYNKSHLNFIKNQYVNQNPDKSLPFVMNGIGYNKNSDILENSPRYELCIDLLNEGYTLNVIEDTNISSKLNTVSESFGGRLKFFKLGTKPEGLLIDL